jgi:hypothetical protein
MIKIRWWYTLKMKKQKEKILKLLSFRNVLLSEVLVNLFVVVFIYQKYESE